MTARRDPPLDDDPKLAENEWDPAEYDDGYSFVYERGADLVDLLDPAAGERVLDLGCGTGHLSAAIADAGADVVGLDREAGMVREAAATHPGPAFLCGDARRLPFREGFDAALSNAALHWIPGPDHGAVLDGLYRALSPGGRFVAELGGPGNVERILEAVHAVAGRRGYETENPWYFPTVGEYASRLEASGFEVRYATVFDRPTELDGGRDGLADWLAMFGDGLLGPVPEGDLEAVVDDVEYALEDALFRDGSWYADYRRLRFLAIAE